MLMKHISRFLPLLVLLAIAACGDPASPADPGTAPLPGVFPNAIGTIWTYKLHNTAHDTDDTIQVRVIDTVRAADGHLASVWMFMDHETVVETKYMAVAGDTVIFYWSPWPYEPAQKPNLHFDHLLLFPAPEGGAWQSATGDTTTVTGTGGSLDVPAGHFDDVTVLTRTFSNGHIARYWLKPHVGIIGMEDPKDWVGAPREEWTLVRFMQ